MAATSTMLPLGTQAPGFALPDVTSGDIVRLEDFAGDDALLVMFICSHCPYVKHVRSQLATLARDMRGTGLGIVAISANDPDTYPEDAPEGLARDAADAGYVFPYLFDESQEVAKAYTAACTPDFFLFDRDRGVGLPRAVGRQPAGERQAGRRSRPPCRDRRGARRHAGRRRPAPERRLQHQVARGQRARLTGTRTDRVYTPRTAR